MLLPAMPVRAGIHCRTTFVDWANSLKLSIGLVCESSGVSEVKYCNAERESERKTAFCGFLSHSFRASVAL